MKALYDPSRLRMVGARERGGHVLRGKPPGFTLSPFNPERRKELEMRRTMSRVTVGLTLLIGAGCGDSSAPPAPGSEGTATASADAGLYCKEHGVPEAYCTLCHPELKETLLLCPEHGDIPEDICTLCHPEVEKKHDIVMCPEGHKLPKHFCFECAKKGAPAA